MPWNDYYIGSRTVLLGILEDVGVSAWLANIMVHVVMMNDIFLDYSTGNQA